MKLSPNMFQMLQEVLRTEPLENAVPLDVPSEELGDQLIKLYYKADKQRSRSLIAKIMQEAGDFWPDKLLSYEGLQTENDNPRLPRLRTLEDFMSLLADSDDYERETRVLCSGQMDA